MKVLESEIFLGISNSTEILLHYAIKKVEKFLRFSQNRSKYVHKHISIVIAAI